MLQTIKLDHQPNLVLSCNKLSNHTLLRSHLSYLQKRPSSSNWKRRMIQLLILILLRPFTLSSTLGTCLTSYNATLAQIIQDFANPESLSRFLTTETYDKVEYLGRTLKVNYADKPKPDKEPPYPETEYKLFVRGQPLPSHKVMRL
ncbi:hypothetical protein IGI04_002224 [Brassica rapa subsp. trilocularis]|uniref:Uncharacterized protein n=1 Tax=Brassica rapa subsp. trilocularis TaxID=1813537 RepID=A0ABQ7NUW4_BRACM|nr:hypothetical protein IGI04_002224 [Brassica rapa subsp. trilocularis]